MLIRIFIRIENCVTVRCDCGTVLGRLFRPVIIIISFNMKIDNGGVRMRIDWNLFEILSQNLNEIGTSHSNEQNPAIFFFFFLLPISTLILRKVEYRQFCMHCLNNLSHSAVNFSSITFFCFTFHLYVCDFILKVCRYFIISHKLKRIKIQEISIAYVSYLLRQLIFTRVFFSFEYSIFEKKNNNREVAVLINSLVMI